MAYPTADMAASNNVSKQPEMMSLSERLASTLGTLRDSNDRASDIVSRFCNEPNPPTSTGATATGPAEPVPGTLGSLNMLADRLATEANRMESLSVRLRSIL